MCVCVWGGGGAIRFRSDTKVGGGGGGGGQFASGPIRKVGGGGGGGINGYNFDQGGCSSTSRARMNLIVVFNLIHCIHS